MEVKDYENWLSDLQRENASMISYRILLNKKS